VPQLRRIKSPPRRVFWCSHPVGLTEFIRAVVYSEKRYRGRLREILPTWQRECYEILETQPKSYASLYGWNDTAGMAKSARNKGSVENSLGGVGYYLTPEEEAEWRKSLFAWDRGSNRSPSCCCRVVTTRKLPRNSRWLDARSRRTSIVCSCVLESTAVSSESNSRQPYTGGSYVWRRTLRKTRAKRTRATSH
jgi:hypothetical protein